MKLFKYFLAVILAATLVVRPVEIKANMGVCTTGTFKSYMPMGALWTGSAQYQYLANNTYDRGDGLLVTNDGFIAVAMGPYYGVLGDKFEITFSNGQVSYFVKVDEKAHFTPGCEGMSSQDGSIIEGILSGNPSDAYSTAQYHGNIGMAYTEFAGSSSIVSIVKVSGSQTVYTPPVQPVIEEPIVLEPEAEIEHSLEPVAPPQIAYTPIIEEGAIEGPKGGRLMIIYIPEEKHENLLFIDTEFSGRDRDLVQTAMILFKKYHDEKNLYFLYGSLNVFSNIEVTEGFENYTNIKQNFLDESGVSEDSFTNNINRFIEINNLNNCNTLLIAHGLNQDQELLLSSGCNLAFVDTYDTYNKAKELLIAASGFSLNALANESGVFLGSNHDAYQDAFALIPIFSQLKMIEYLE